MLEAAADRKIHRRRRQYLVFPFEDPTLESRLPPKNQSLPSA